MYTYHHLLLPLFILSTLTVTGTSTTTTASSSEAKPSSVITTTTDTYSFSTVLATDLQPLFNIQIPWLGADISTSFRLAADPTASTYLWLHGDTLIGTMNTSDNSRIVQGMPRNSIGILNVSNTTGTPLGTYQHYIRSKPDDPVHYGFFSPSNTSNWYWITGGLMIPETSLPSEPVSLVFAYREENAGSGLFPFATAGIDVLYLSPTSAYTASDPMQWPEPFILTLPNINNSFNIGSAITLGDEYGLPLPLDQPLISNLSSVYVYLLGSGGTNGQQTILGRILLSYVLQEDWSHIQYYSNSSTWVPFTNDLVPSYLFWPAASETTLVYHEYLQAWYMVMANTFMYNSIGIRTAPTLMGPWSDFISLYPLPTTYTYGGAFCYAGKGHPEFTVGNPNELITTFMCNTPTIPELLNRTDIYVPQFLRTTITSNT